MIDILRIAIARKFLDRSMTHAMRALLAFSYWPDDSLGREVGNVHLAWSDLLSELSIAIAPNRPTT